jgi:hypothetical protein
MKFRFVAPALAVMLLALVSSSAQAGLFWNHGHGGCGCEPACGAPVETCCAPEPSCCAPEPCCCDCGGCGHRHGGLLGHLKHRCRGGLFGCHRGCGCEVACEPACGCEPACEPACGCEPACEPACGCEPACDPCCRKRCGGLLHRLFAHKHRGCGCCAAPACGCAAEVSCGCEPVCGCN